MKAFASVAPMLLCSIMLGFAGNVEAQTPGTSRADLKAGARIGIGYVANLPNTFLGFSAIATQPGFLGGAGVYADVKITTGSTRADPYYMAGISGDDAVITFGDFLSRERTEWVSVNLAFLYAVTSDFNVFAGGGYSRGQHYQEYYDDSRTRGLFGFYWVSDSARDDIGLNLLGGVMLRIADVALLQLGMESRPIGATAGVIFPIPI